MIVIELPPPPSSNGLFKNIPGRGRVKVKAYRQWLWDAGWAVQQQKIKPIKGPVTLLYEHSNKRRADLGNLEKAASDLLVAHHVIEDDNPKIVRGIQSVFSEGVEGVRVTITPVSEDSFQSVGSVALRVVQKLEEKMTTHERPRRSTG